ncbi:MAG: CsbD family protein [Thermoanaerobaculia bacterium]
MRKQEIRGKVKKTQGKVKEAVGILSGNKKLEREGSVQRTEGALQEGLGKARRKVGEMLTNLGKAVSG